MGIRIITVSRQFGSGGRELGKRLSDLLGWDYYDREIIQALADEQGLDPEYVRRVVNGHGWNHYQLTYRNSFRQPADDSWRHTEVLVRQREILREVAEAGNHCVIVGRDADVILRDRQPFRIFVCAEMEAKIKRCFERAPKEENLTEKEMRRKIKQVDKARAQTRAILSGSSWGDPEGYHLTVNTTGWDLKELAKALAGFTTAYFESQKD